MSSSDNIAAKYKSLRLNSTAESLIDIARTAEENDISYLQFADTLATHEIASREQKRVTQNMKRAVFPVLSIWKSSIIVSRPQLQKNR